MPAGVRKHRPCKLKSSMEGFVGGFLGVLFRKKKVYASAKEGEISRKKAH